MRRYFLVLLGILLAMAGSAYGEFIVPPVPNTPIYDDAGILNQDEKKALEQDIIDYEKETHHQIAIAILQSLQGRTIEDAGLAIGRGWGIGQKQADNGLLILIAPNEREARIEVGRGLEGVMTDALSHRVIEENLLPHFRDTDYIGGIKEALTRIKPILKGETVTLPDMPNDPAGVLFALLFWLVWGGFFLGSVIFEPSKSWWPGIIIGIILGGVVMWIAVGSALMIVVGMIASGTLLGGLDYAFSKGIVATMKSRPNGGRWNSGGGFGGFGGGSSGGGFGGFGGGGFGGGGASGRW